MRFWRWLLHRVLWWRQPAVQADQVKRDQRVEEASRRARQVVDRIDRMADDYRAAERALRAEVRRRPNH